MVLLDEPTAAPPRRGLGVAQTRQVLDLVRRLAEQGLGVVIISHNMNEVLEVSDRVACMYVRRVVADVEVDGATTREFLVELITSGRSGDVELREEATI